MPVIELTAAAAVKAVLLSGDFGGAITAEADTLISAVADAFAKCIAHYAAQNTVSTNVTGAITGGTPASPGAFAGTGTGTIGGLVKGDALLGTGLAGEIMSELESASYGGTITGVARTQMALLCNACAGFADYVMANATVSTTDVGVAASPNLNGASTGTGSGNAV